VAVPVAIRFLLLRKIENVRSRHSLMNKMTSHSFEPHRIIGVSLTGSRTRLPVRTTQIPSQGKGGQSVKSTLTYVYNWRGKSMYLYLCCMSHSVYNHGVKTARIWSCWFISWASLIKSALIIHFYNPSTTCFPKWSLSFKFSCYVDHHTQHTCHVSRNLIFLDLMTLIIFGEVQITKLLTVSNE
jgi:hypothetical protein